MKKNWPELDTCITSANTTIVYNLDEIILKMKADTNDLLNHISTTLITKITHSSGTYTLDGLFTSKIITDAIFSYRGKCKHLTRV